MTIESRRFVTLDEILGIEYTCSQCDIKVWVPRDKGKWKTITRACPGGCTTPQGAKNSWFDIDSQEYKAVLMLVNAIDGLIAARENGVGCKLKLEVRQED